MSKSTKPFIPIDMENSYSDDDSFSKTTVKQLRDENDEQKFLINTMKAEIRLLRDTINSFHKSSKQAIMKHDCMNDLAESRIESGAYKKYLNDKINYPGEETYEQYKKRKESSNDSNSDSS